MTPEKYRRKRPRMQAEIVAPDSGGSPATGVQNRKYKHTRPVPSPVSHLPLDEHGFARYVACLVDGTYHGDFRAAAKELIGDSPKVAEAARLLEAHPLVREERQKIAALGAPSEEAAALFFQTIRDWLVGKDVPKALKAAGIFGDLYVAKRIVAEKPEPLPISGFDEGVRHLMGVEEAEAEAIEETIQ